MKSLRVSVIVLAAFLGVLLRGARGLPGGGLNLPQVPKIYDFVIVGGGTAGCALAARISENGKYSVLLLEAGGVPPEIMDVPGFALTNELNPDLTFQYHSIRQNAGLGTNGGVVRIGLGRVLGGTSQINHMKLNRGSPYDFNRWANVTGDSSWRYDNMLQYFKKSETYLGQFPSAEHHGFNGPIPLSYHEYSPGRNEWFKAGRELGFQVKDSNGPQEISFSPVEYATRFGRRVSSYKGYLLPVMNSRSNLKVVTNAYVTRVLFVGNTAIGVRYNADGSSNANSLTTTMAYAKREVILSSGTYGSATLLQRSGIGPRRVLRQAGIPIKLDLPVGENLQDHPILPIHFVLNNKSLALDPPRDFNPRNYQLYLRSGQGPYTSVAGDGPQAFLSTSVASREGFPDWSDLQISVKSVSTRLPFYRNFSTAQWETPISAHLYVGRSRSRGSVKVNPSNVDGEPIIDFNYLGDGTDEQILLEAIDVTMKIFEGTQTYRKLGARFPPDPIAACSHLKFRSRQYWRCYIRQALLPGNHPGSSCSMGKVVDSSLRVLGMKGLRVVDASIMPYITNANLSAAIYAIAEKAAADILREHSKLTVESLVNFPV